MRDFRTLVVSGSPDHLNSNAALRSYVVEGFRAAFPSCTAKGASFDAAVSEIRSLKPELLLIFGSVMLDQSDFHDLAWEAKQIGSIIAFWLHDDPYEFDMNYRAYGYADIIFSNDRASIDHYPPNLKVMHLPMAASIEAHLRPRREKVRPDLFFCGHAFENRQAFLAELAARQMLRDRTFFVVGSGWDCGRVPVATNVRIQNSALADLYASARVVLNIGRDMNIANERFGIRPSTPGPRTFEAALAGACQIFITSGLEVAEYFAPNEEIVLAESVDEFVDAWLALLDDQERMLDIASRAQSRCLADHTYEKRARQITNTILGVDRAD